MDIAAELLLEPHALQTKGLGDRSFCSALLSDEYENHMSKAAALANTKATNSAAPVPTDHDSIDARPQRNPLGRQIQAIRRARVSTAEGPSGL